MSLASWFRLPKFHFPSARLKPARRPARTRPFLESLEERAVPTSASNNILGFVNNASSFAAFNTQQSGINLPTLPVSGQLNGLAVGTFLLNSGTPNILGSALGANSQGQAQLGQPILFTPNSIFFSSYGFGSGTQPNQPWVPNAYNLGLAKGQMSFPSMSDFGSFQNYGSGVRYPRFAFHQQPQNDTDPLEHNLPLQDARAFAEVGETDALRAEQQSDTDGGAENGIDPDRDALFQPIPILAQPATQEESAVQPTRKLQETANEMRPHGALPIADASDENAQGEEAFPVGRLYSPETNGLQDVVFPANEWRQNADDGEFLDSDLVHDVPPLETLNLPSTLLLTVLTPIQLTTLMAEPPVATVPAQRGVALDEFDETA